MCSLVCSYDDRSNLFRGLFAFFPHIFRLRFFNFDSRVLGQGQSRQRASIIKWEM